MTQDKEFQDKANALFKAFGATVEKQPRAFTQFLIAHDFALGPRMEIAVSAVSEATAASFFHEINSRFLPRAVVLFHPAGEKGEQIEKLASFLEGQGLVSGRAAAYLCENYACRLPLTEAEALGESLDALGAGHPK